MTERAPPEEPAWPEAEAEGFVPKSKEFSRFERLIQRILAIPKEEATRKQRRGGKGN